MNTIEVKLAGMHSNIGFMEADLAETDFRNSIILEDSVAEVDTTADKERVLAECNDLGDSELDVDVKDDVNSTSALLDEIAQTISAIEEAHGVGYEGQHGTFEVQDGVYEVQDGVDGEIAYNVDTGEPEIDYIPKFNLDIPGGETFVIHEGVEEDNGDVDKNNVKLDFEDLGDEMNTKGNLPEGDLDIDINANAKLVEGNIDSSIDAKTDEINPPTAELPSPFANGSGGEVEINVDTGEQVFVSPPTSGDGVNGVELTADPNSEIPPDSSHVKFDLGKNETGDTTTDNVKIPSTNVTKSVDHDKPGDKKKKGGFHFNFPWFGSKKPTATHTDKPDVTDVAVDTKHAADVSLDTDDLPEVPVQSNGTQQATMVADVKADGDTATLHVRTDSPKEAPKKPPRDPSVNSEAEVNNYQMDIDAEVPQGTDDANIERDGLCNVDVGGAGGIFVSSEGVDVGTPDVDLAPARKAAPELESPPVEVEAPETELGANASLEVKAPEAELNPVEVKVPELDIGKGDVPQKKSASIEIEAHEAKSASLKGKAPEGKSTSLKVKTPEVKQAKVKAHKVKSAPADVDVAVNSRAKAKKKSFTLPSFKSSKNHGERTSPNTGAINGSTGGSLQVKTEVPDVSGVPDVSVEGGGDLPSINVKSDGDTRVAGGADDVDVEGTVNVRGMIRFSYNTFA